MGSSGKDDSALLEAAHALTKEDIEQLVTELAVKDDDTRYRAFLLLQSKSAFSADVYPYWDTFQSKLNSDSSYQRSIGLMLLAENAKWDLDNRMEAVIDEYLTFLDDEKPITIRQCIQSLGKIIEAKPNLDGKVATALLSFDLTAVKDTMRKSMLMDILRILCSIRTRQKTAEIESFVSNALAGEVLGKRSKKQIEDLLSQP